MEAAEEIKASRQPRGKLRGAGHGVAQKQIGQNVIFADTQRANFIRTRLDGWIAGVNGQLKRIERGVNIQILLPRPDPGYVNWVPKISVQPSYFKAANDPVGKLAPAPP